NLGKIYAENGKVYKALDVLSYALTLNTDNANLHNSIGNVYLLMCQHLKAIFHFKRALDIDPLMIVATINLGLTYLNTGNVELAYQSLSEVVKNELSLDYLWGKAVAGYALCLRHLLE